MNARPRVILSAFGDEASIHKSAAEQFAALTALGLQFYSLRFIDLGSGVKNVMDLTKAEVTTLRHQQAEYDLNVASIGSPLGKVKLVDKEDGTNNKFVPFKKYLEKDVKHACEVAHALETKLIRGFSFYPPAGESPADYLSQAADQLGQMVEVCHRSDLTFGLEIEANLIGQTGQLIAELHRQVNHPALVTVYDGANITCQGYSTMQCFEQYLAMKPSIGWMHVKDYLDPQPGRTPGRVDEEALKNFVPVDRGDSGYAQVLADFAREIPALEKRLTRRGIPGVILDLEPHLKGGGQFGGWSGPDGMRVALNGLTRVLDFVQIDYHLRDFEDVRASRGF